MISSMSAYTLLVRSLHDEDPLGAKRCLLHATRLREMGLATGDVVCSTPAGATQPVSLYSVVRHVLTSRRSPCASHGPRVILVYQVSTQLLKLSILTEHTTEISLSYNSAKALSLDSSSKLQLWKPLSGWAQQIRRAARVTIKEVSASLSPSTPTTQRADWLKLFAREILSP